MAPATCSERAFPLHLALEFERTYRSHLRWLRYLLVRLGRKSALTLWHDAFVNYDDVLLNRILEAEWKEVPGGRIKLSPIDTTAVALKETFPSTIEGFSDEEAKQLIETSPPILQIKQRFPSRDVSREITTFESLHLGFDAQALLAESLIKHHGKEGELIVYDLCREGRVATGQGGIGSISDFMASYASAHLSPEPNIFTAGLSVEVVHASDSEVLLNIKECEFSRYFQEHHPHVGYLMICSTDESAYRAFNKNIQMQRTSTLMEGGPICAIRVKVDRIPPSPFPAAFPFAGLHREADSRH